MESDDEDLCRFGTALEPLKEDEVPTKKPILIEDQIVTDENGKRRFHGAFTGGFSAGFWNTVGSLEGWKPQEFKSSRNEKAEHKKQQPVDFMDDEDMGEFGIAPQRVQATEDFSHETSNRKRKLQQNQPSNAPIPGVPVLHQLLRPAREGVAIRLLKQMGWKPGQGIGERMTYQKKKLAAKYNNREQYVMQKYGCEVGPLKEHTEDENEDQGENDEIDDEKITFAPDDFEPYICSIKDNLFGIGYSGLSRDLVLSSGKHVNLFGNLEILDKNNKKLSIRGQAFGVGALEEEDEDIYQRDDMSKYDFSLDKKGRIKSVKTKTQNSSSLDGFHEKINIKSSATKKQFIVSLPEGFVPRNWLFRKSRFEPLDEKRLNVLKQHDEHKVKGLGRHDLNPEQRGNILGEPSTSGCNKPKVAEKSEPKLSYLDRINKKYEETQVSQQRNQILEKITTNFDKFNSDDKSTSVVHEKVQTENAMILENAKEITKGLGSSSGSFKPFSGNSAKQERYEQFIENVKSFDDIEEIRTFLKTLQPIELSEWDREMEIKEFIQAKRIYQPLKGLMSDRFVSESNLQTEVVSNVNAKEPDKSAKRKTVRMKSVWKPCSQLCKRFNIAEPFGGTLKEPDEKPSSKPKYSVFDYIETSINRKDDFVTPVIIPKKQPENAKKISDKNLEQNIANNQETENNLNISEKKDLQVLETAIPSTIESTATLNILAKEKQRPKSELEIRIEETKSKHPSEKKDLFKAIFDSSSEDENETDDVKPSVMNEATDLDPNDILKNLSKPACELNILRNNSPPRGIFAAFFNKSVSVDAANSSSVTECQPEDENRKLDKLEVSQEKTKEKIIFTPSYKRLSEKCAESEEQPEVYGPKLPEKNTNLLVTQEATEDKVNAKLLEKNDVMKTGKKSKIIEAWVEKPVILNKQKSHHKKKKKSKSKSKDKHKEESKSKKNSKSKDHKKDRKSKKKKQKKM